uniref:Uncharacterized protein n=1 Tax=Kalanchoe fedtschenkoi TaxID=63787 RepID=A0A7N0UAG4_KALFE
MEGSVLQAGLAERHAEKLVPHRIEVHVVEPGSNRLSAVLLFRMDPALDPVEPVVSDRPKVAIDVDGADDADK